MASSIAGPLAFPTSTPTSDIICVSGRLDQLHLPDPKSVSPASGARSAPGDHRTLRGSASFVDSYRNAFVGAAAATLRADAALPAVAETLAAGASQVAGAAGALAIEAAPVVAGAAAVLLPMNANQIGQTELPGESEHLWLERTVPGAHGTASRAHPDAGKPHVTILPTQPREMRDAHTTHPIEQYDPKAGIHTTPAEPSTKVTHTGQEAPDFSALTKPTGTAIHKPSGADLMTEKTRPVHAGISDHPAPNTVYRPHGPYAEFDTFEKLKDHLGSAGANRDWHHIVGQHQANVEKFGAKAIHNTANVVSIDRTEAHHTVNGVFATKNGGVRIRDSVGQLPYEQQRAYGEAVLGDLGVTIK